MTTLAAGASITVTLTAGQSIQFAPSGLGQVVFGPGPLSGQSSQVGAVLRVFGPFPVSQVLYVTANSLLTYSVLKPNPQVTVISSDVPIDSDGRPDGTIYVQTA